MPENVQPDVTRAQSAQNSLSLSITVDPNEIPNGGSTTITLDASDHTSLEIEKLWTDWQITSIDPDGGETSTSAGDTPDTGTVTFEWQSTQDASKPSVTVDLPPYYIGGTYEIDAIATEGSQTLEKAATLTVTGTSPPINEQAKLIASDGDAFEEFGSSVAISGDGSTAIVGSRRATDSDGVDTGAAYLFSRSGGSWQEEQKILADDGEKGAHFGGAVAMSDDGSTALVGARYDSGSELGNSGSTYVFTRSNGSWQQQDHLFLTGDEEEENFGNSVALTGDGTTAIIGAIRKDSDAGAAYVYSLTDGSWSSEDKLAASDGEQFDLFGSAVAISDDGSTAVVGARRHDTADGDNAGSAYVFSKTSGSWQEETELRASDAGQEDQFGTSIAMSDDGSLALVGADGNGPNNPGAAYLFSNATGSWQEEKQFVSDDGDTTDEFGSAVALSNDGNIVLVGASGDVPVESTVSGSTFVFTKADGNWQQETMLYDDTGDSGNNFGDTVSMTDAGGTAIIGALFNPNQNGDDAGAAYIFE